MASMMYGNLPGDKYRSRDMELAQQLIAQSENNGTITSGLASILKKGMAGFLMGEDKKKSDAYNKALTEGLATPYSPAMEAQSAVPYSDFNTGEFEADEGLNIDMEFSGDGSNPEILKSLPEGGNLLEARDAQPADGPMRGAQRNLRALLATGPNERAQRGLLPLTMAQYGQDRAAQLAKTARANKLLDANTEFERRQQLEEMKLGNKPPKTIKTGEGVFILNSDGTLGKRLGSSKADTEIIMGGSLNKGFRPKLDKDGKQIGAEFVPGGSQDPETIQAKKEAERLATLNIKNLEKLPGRRAQIFAAEQNAPAFEAAVDKAIEAAKSPLSSGIAQQVLGNVGRGPAFDLERALDTIKANIGFGELIRIKESGGTLGALSEMENRLLQAMQGALDPRLKKEDMISALERVREIQKANLEQKKRDFKAMYPKENRPWENGQKFDASGKPVVPSGANSTKPKIIRYDAQGNIIK